MLLMIELWTNMTSHKHDRAFELEEDSFISQMDSSLKTLLETFLTLNTSRMKLVLLQFSKIFKFIDREIEHNEDVTFEESNFVENLNPEMKVLLEIFLMFDKQKMSSVLRQFQMILKYLSDSPSIDKESSYDENMKLTDKAKHHNDIDRFKKRSRKPLYPCTKCDLIFTNKKLMKKHKRKVHDEKEIEKEFFGLVHPFRQVRIESCSVRNHFQPTELEFLNLTII